MKQLYLTIFIIFAGFSEVDSEMTPGEFKMYATVVITEDWCYMPDGTTRANGVTKFNTVVRSVAKICVSLKSDDPERTLQHELAHAWRNAVGMEALWAGHKLHCSRGTC